MGLDITPHTRTSSENPACISYLLSSSSNARATPGGANPSKRGYPCRESSLATYCITRTASQRETPLRTLARKGFIFGRRADAELVKGLTDALAAGARRLERRHRTRACQGHVARVRNDPRNGNRRARGPESFRPSFLACGDELPALPLGARPEHSREREDPVLHRRWRKIPRSIPSPSIGAFFSTPPRRCSARPALTTLRLTP